MLICMNCRLEYEEGTEVCPLCGDSLTTKEKTAPSDATPAGAEEIKPDGRLICPDCRILYERMKTCVRCGAPLVKQSELHEREERKPPQAAEDKKEEPGTEPPQVQPPRKAPPGMTREKPKPFSPAEREQEPPFIETPERPLFKESNLLTPEKGRKNLVRSPGVVVGIIVLIVAAIYAFSSLYLSAKRPRESTGPSDPTVMESNEKPSLSLPFSSIPVVSASQEIEKIKDLLENIRQANLRKNIDLFMSCYSADFKDWEERRRATLESWATYNFLELSYVLRVNSISINSSEARVEWWMRFIPRKGGQPEESRHVLDVSFQKENNEWKIKEVAPAS